MRSLLKAATRETATSRSDCIAPHYSKDYTINSPIIIPITRGHRDIKRIKVIFCHEEDKEIFFSLIDRCMCVVVLAPKILMLHDSIRACYMCMCYNYTRYIYYTAYCILKREKRRYPNKSLRKCCLASNVFGFVFFFTIHNMIKN